MTIKVAGITLSVHYLLGMFGDVRTFCTIDLPYVVSFGIRKCIEIELFCVLRKVMEEVFSSLSYFIA